MYSINRNFIFIWSFHSNTGWYYCVPILQRKSLCWDATCTNTYASSSAVSVGHAALEAEERKRRNYRAVGCSLQVWAHRIRDSRCIRRVHSSTCIYLRSVDVSLRQQERAGRLFDLSKDLVWQCSEAMRSAFWSYCALIISYYGH